MRITYLNFSKKVNNNSANYFCLQSDYFLGDVINVAELSTSVDNLNKLLKSLETGMTKFLFYTHNHSAEPLIKIEMYDYIDLPIDYTLN